MMRSSGSGDWSFLRNARFTLPKAANGDRMPERGQNPTSRREQPFGRSAPNPCILFLFSGKQTNNPPTMWLLALGFTAEFGAEELVNRRNVRTGPPGNPFFEAFSGQAGPASAQSTLARKPPSGRLPMWKCAPLCSAMSITIARPSPWPDTELSSLVPRSSADARSASATP